MFLGKLNCFYMTQETLFGDGLTFSTFLVWSSNFENAKLDLCFYGLP